MGDASRIFISYRRGDTIAHAGRLYDRLSEHFGDENVFMDVDTIEPGLDFVEVIENAVGSCDVFLALVGDSWLTEADQNGRRRLDNPDDFVRLELAASLERGIRVIPILVQGATMPSSTELPEHLAKFSRRNAFDIDDRRWRQDVERLIGTIEKVLGGVAPRQAVDEAKQEEAVQPEAADVPHPQPGAEIGRGIGPQDSLGYGAEPPAPASRFSEVDRQYADLKSLYDGGDLSAEAFDRRLKEMMVEDDKGRWWAKSRATGDWYYHDGSTWVQASPLRPRRPTSRGTLSQRLGAQTVNATPQTVIDEKPNGAVDDRRTQHQADGRRLPEAGGQRRRWLPEGGVASIVLDAALVLLPLVVATDLLLRVRWATLPLLVIWVVVPLIYFGFLRPRMPAGIRRRSNAHLTVSSVVSLVVGSIILGVAHDPARSDLNPGQWIGLVFLVIGALGLGVAGVRAVLASPRTQ